MTDEDDGRPGGSGLARERLAGAGLGAEATEVGPPGPSAKASSSQLRVTINVAPPGRRLSDDVRASLEAVREAQLVARKRARRETLRARVIVGGIAAVAVVGLFVVRPRLRAGRLASAATPTKSLPAAPQGASGAEAGAVGAAAAPPAGGLLAAGVADLPAKASPTFPPVVADAVECQDHYTNKRWKAAADSCTAAFAARPDDAELALHATEALYARDRLGEARDWAQKTLALAPNQAIALGILGRIERRSGDVEAAARTFRRYLAVAPRGWQAPEAHAALRAARARAPRPPAAPVVVAAPRTSTTPPPVRSEDAPLPPSAEPEAPPAEAPRGGSI